jgi:L-cysteine:1D-myo-inositol 2-amino-2-deoxy-alpha-D-glucopyranoside ligase
LADGTDPMVIRLVLLAHHYRSDWEYSPAALEAAKARLDRWREAVSAGTGADVTATLDAVRAHLRHDLDAPAALAAIDEWAAATGDDTQAPRQVRDLVDALLGIAL